MKKLADIIRTLNWRKFTNETLYHLRGLQAALNELSDEVIDVEKDRIITPNYTSRRTRMELYAYTLQIFINKPQSFEEYLMEGSQWTRIEDIPDDLLERRRNCYVRCEKNTTTVKIEYLQRYIDFLCAFHEVKEDAEYGYGSFDADNLYFDFF